MMMMLGVILINNSVNMTLPHYSFGAQTLAEAERGHGDRWWGLRMEVKRNDDDK